MNLIRASIDRPIAVISVMIMVLMFGMLALRAIPVQLAPDVQRPVINVSSSWPGAAPAEIEREIINQQEEVLAGVEGLTEMHSTSSRGNGSIELEFSIGTDLDRALLLVANRLDRVTGYPAEAEEPTLETAGANDNAIAWFLLRRQPGNDTPIHTYGEFARELIKERLERVPGVGFVNVYGGTERQLQIVIDPQRMASYGLTIGETLAALRAANISSSAGQVDEGKRRYVVRSEGELNDPEAVREVLLRSVRDPVSGEIVRVRVADIARLQFDHSEPGAQIRGLGEPAIAINAIRETGANVIETMAGIRAAIDELNERIIPDAGLTLKQTYDETVYIQSAIELVRTNIWVGGTLAAIILMLFLRSFGATAIVSIAIPVSVIGSFVAMAAMGRSINVISLAGLAFAVGMVVDAAIVVLENIYRLRQSGMPIREAAYRGTSQVWGAVLVSALTTVMVFIPILVMELAVGQLFRDIAVAISVAVVLSLLVAATVIPALSLRLLRGDLAKHAQRKLPVVDEFASGFKSRVMRYVHWATESRARAIPVVATVCGVSAVVTFALMPKLEYLPEGNRNLMFGFVIPPPGYNLETATDIARRLEDEIRHLWTLDASGNAVPDVDTGDLPGINHFFFVAQPHRTFMGASSDQPERVAQLKPTLSAAAFREPGSFGFVTQPSIFGRGIGGGRAVDLNISGDNLEDILEVAQRAVGKLFQVMPFSEGNQMTPHPGLELGAPEVRVRPNRVRLADSGVSARELSLTVDAYNDGVRVAEITVGSERVDLTLMGERGRIQETQGIAALPVLTADGAISSVGELATVEMTQGPIQIRHRERRRTITLNIRPADKYPLELAMELVEDEIMAPLLAEGIPQGVRLQMSGTADRLRETWDAMKLQFLMAIVIVYLVMAILFESFFYPLIIMLSVPLATAGAMLGLNLTMLLVESQRFDMLTLLGFVILVGIVVNNAILLVHQSLHHVREENMAPRAAIIEAVNNRVRPIFMSTLTSVFGMLPLVLFPGAGSELYRGLGSVVLGGLALSAVLTLAIIPPLLAIFLRPAEPVLDSASARALS